MILPKCKSDHSLKSPDSSLNPTGQTSDSYVWYSRGFMILNYTLLWVSPTGLLTIHRNRLHKFMSYAFGYAFVSDWIIPNHLTRSKANIMSSVKSFLTLTGPTEVLSGALKALLSYLCYRTYWNAFWRVGYVTVLHCWVLLKTNSMPHSAW